MRSVAPRKLFACRVVLANGERGYCEVMAEEWSKAVEEVLKRLGCRKPYRVGRVSEGEMEVYTSLGRIRLSVALIGEEVPLFEE